MKRLLRFSILVLVMFLLPAIPGNHSDASGAEPNLIAFVHATVIPMDTERALPDHTVIVADGEIVEIGPSSEVNVPAEAFRVDATGRYLLPALCDMHVHLVSEAWDMMLKPEVRASIKEIPFDRFLFPYVAKGVTTVQVLSATPEDVAVRNRIARGELLGPRLILARMVDGPGKAWPPPLSSWVSSAQEAREAVRAAKDAGYDKIKVYSFLDRESYDAIVSTAKELNMDVIGHVPMSLSVEYVLDAGQKLIAHSEEVMKHARGNYSAERIDYFARKMAERGVWMAPTLVTTRSILEVFDDSDGVFALPEAAYFRHPLQAGIWSFIVENLYKPIPAESRKKLRDGFDFQRSLTTAFHEKGGKLMAGSDTIIPGLVAGFALHKELTELVAVGLTPFEALRTSTTLPFEYLGEIDKAGTIEVGKHSDLILVDENPLKDVSGASKVAGVLIQGRWVGTDEIQQRMREIALPFEVSGASSHASH